MYLGFASEVASSYRDKIRTRPWKKFSLNFGLFFWLLVCLFDYISLPVFLSLSFCLSLSLILSLTLSRYIAATVKLCLSAFLYLFMT